MAAGEGLQPSQLEAANQPAAEPTLLWPPFLVTGLKRNKLHLWLQIHSGSSIDSSESAETSSAGVRRGRSTEIVAPTARLSISNGSSFFSKDSVTFASAVSYRFRDDESVAFDGRERSRTNSSWPVHVQNEAASTEAALEWCDSTPLRSSAADGAIVPFGFSDLGSRLLLPLSPIDSESPFAGIALPPRGPSSSLDSSNWSDASGPTAPVPQQHMLTHGSQLHVYNSDLPQQQQRLQASPVLSRYELAALDPPSVAVGGGDRAQVQLPPQQQQRQHPPSRCPVGGSNTKATTALRTHHTVSAGGALEPDYSIGLQRFLKESGNGAGGDGEGGDGGGGLLPACVSPFLSAAFAPWQPPKLSGAASHDTKASASELIATSLEALAGETLLEESAMAQLLPITREALPVVCDIAQRAAVVLCPAAVAAAAVAADLDITSSRAAAAAVLPPPRQSLAVLRSFASSPSMAVCGLRLDAGDGDAAVLSAHSYSHTGILLPKSSTLISAAESARTPMAPSSPVKSASAAATEGQRPLMNAPLLNCRLTLDLDSPALGASVPVVDQEVVLLPAAISDDRQKPGHGSSIGGFPAVAFVSIDLPELQLPGVLHLRLTLPAHTRSSTTDIGRRLPQSIAATRGDEQLPLLPPSAPLQPLPSQTPGASPRNVSSTADPMPAAPTSLPSSSLLVSMAALALPPHVYAEVGDLFADSVRRGLPGAPLERLRQLEVLALPVARSHGISGDGSASSGEGLGSSRSGSASVAFCTAANHHHHSRLGKDTGAAKSVALLAGNVSSSPSRTCTPLTTAAQAAKAAALPHVVCHPPSPPSPAPDKASWARLAAEQLLALLTSQEPEDGWPLPPALSAAAAWVWEEHMMPLLNDMAAVLSYGISTAASDATAAAAASVEEVMEIFVRLFGFLETVGDKEQLLSFLACDAPAALQKCMLAAASAAEVHQGVPQQAADSNKEIVMKAVAEGQGVSVAVAGTCDCETPDVGGATENVAAGVGEEVGRRCAAKVAVELQVNGPEAGLGMVPMRSVPCTSAAFRFPDEEPLGLRSATAAELVVGMMSDPETDEASTCGSGRLASLPHPSSALLPPPLPPPLPPFVPLPTVAVPPSGSNVIDPPNFHELLDLATAFASLPAGGTTGGNSSSNSWAQWEEEAGASGTNLWVHPPIGDVRQLARSFSEAAVTSGLGAIGFFGFPPSDWLPAAGGGNGEGESATHADAGSSDLAREAHAGQSTAHDENAGKGCFGGSNSGSGDMGVKIPAAGILQRDITTAAVAMTPSRPRRTHVVTRPSMAQFHPDEGVGCFKGALRLEPDAGNAYGNNGALHSNTRSPGFDYSSSRGGSGGGDFGFIPIPPPAPKRGRGPPPEPHDTFEEQWRAAAAVFQRDGFMEEGSAGDSAAVQALLTAW